MFLHRTDPACEGGPYTYDALIDAALDFPGFGTTGSVEERKREVAAFLAQVSHETTGGWPTAPDGPSAWGLCFREEVACRNTGCPAYCVPNSNYPCVSGKSYHGRGPMQLSYNYNYGPAGAELGRDLLAEPELVANDGYYGWATALWFWMTATVNKPSAHDVMTGVWAPTSADRSAGRVPGFGMTTNIINGGVECGRPTPATVEDRIAFFQRYAGMLGVYTGPALDCSAMRPYY